MTPEPPKTEKIDNNVFLWLVSVYVCTLALSGPEFLDPSTVTQCEVQVGYRYTMHVFTRMSATSLGFWIIGSYYRYTMWGSA